jgi:putative tryptophan/tyrosine transport system substrate-binding protein
MTGSIKAKKKNHITWAGLIGLLLIILGGCSPQPDKMFTIGMVNDILIREHIFDGFKAGMTESGYAEGKNIKYIYDGVTGSKNEVIDAQIKKLLLRDIDLLLVLGNTVAFRAQKVLEGTNIPIVVVAVGDAVESGLVESLGQPGGNITGVQIVDFNLKGLEWLTMISPGIKKVYLPYDAADNYSIKSMEDLKKSASKMGIELVLNAVHTADEAAASIERLPKDIDAVYRTSAPALDSENNKLSQAAIKRGLPMVASTPLDEDVLLTCATSIFEMGRQAARFAEQIRHGVKPAGLPVETAEVFLTINLKTAEKIGIHMPEVLLLNANKIIR